MIRRLSAAGVLALIATTSQSNAEQTSFPNGLHCWKSPFVYGDILPERGNEPGTWVVSIDKVLIRDRTVGYVYNMKDGVRLIQGTYEMPAQVLEQLRTTPLAVHPLHTPLPAVLRIIACPQSELTKRPKR